MLQKWRNIGQVLAVLVRISDCWGAPDDNCFTLSRSVEVGVHWVPCLEGKKEIPAYMSTPQLNRRSKRSEASALVPWISAKVLASISVKQLLLQDEAYLASVAEVGLVMTGSLSQRGRIFFCGNGGSAADAQHLAAELTGRFLKDRSSLAGIALTTNTSTLTAIANDYSYEEVFSRQIEGLAQAGDVLLGISTSGNSENVLRAMEVARRMMLSTVALTGKSGGKLATAAEHCIRIPSDETPRIQEAHILTGHILAELVEAELFGE